jgi:hypothetical protein
MRKMLGIVTWFGHVWIHARREAGDATEAPASCRPTRGTEAPMRVDAFPLGPSMLPFG